MSSWLNLSFSSHIVQCVARRNQITSPIFTRKSQLNYRPMSYKFYFLHNHRTNFSQVFALTTRVPIFFYLTGVVLCLATQSCLTLCDPMHCNLSGWGFSREEYWSWLPCPPPGDLPNPVIEPSLPHFRQILYCLNHQGSPWSSIQVLTRLNPV